MNFRVEPVYLSPEHARQVERFTGYLYGPEESARLRAWACFKRWHWQQLKERDGDQAARGRRRVEGRSVVSGRTTATIIPFHPRAAGSDR